MTCYALISCPNSYVALLDLNMIRVKILVLRRFTPLKLIEVLQSQLKKFEFYVNESEHDAGFLN